MNSKEKIKLKIKALLSKTTENGASEHEAIIALSKAKELMEQYFITESDVKNPFLGEKCVLKSTNLIKTNYNTSLFYNELAKLFDCEYYFTGLKIYFFGFNQDVELCIYFYELILKACMNEKIKFMNSEDYVLLKSKYHGRTLVSSFIKGFLLRIAQKMNKMYEERKSERSKNEYGIILYSKKNKVDNEFSNLNLSIKMERSKDLNYERIAFRKGVLKGDGFSISQGINKSAKQNTLQIG